MSAVILEDFFKCFINKPLTEKETHYIMRGVVAVFGAICVCLVLVVEKLGAVLQLSMSLGAVTNGPLLGIFTMGVMLPWVHGTGAIIGGATGLIVMAWICAKAQTALASGELTFVTKPVDTQGCSYTFVAAEPLSMLSINDTEMLVIDEGIDEPEFAIYHISFMWYTLFGAIITIVVSLIASFIVGANNPRNIDPKLLAPFVRKLLGNDDKSEEQLDTEDGIRYVSCLELKAIPTKA